MDNAQVVLVSVVVTESMGVAINMIVISVISMTLYMCLLIWV